VRSTRNGNRLISAALVVSRLTGLDVLLRCIDKMITYEQPRRSLPACHSSEDYVDVTVELGEPPR
jgi:hypothetical protein